MSHFDDDDRTIDASELMDREIARMKAGIPDHAGQKREIAFRHGYYRGFADALDIVFNDLLKVGSTMSVEDVYRIVARYENEVVAHWSTQIDPGGTPHFDRDALEKLIHPTTEE